MEVVLKASFVTQSGNAESIRGTISKENKSNWSVCLNIFK